MKRPFAPVFLWIIVSMLLAQAPATGAMDSNELYSAVVPVEDYSETARNNAIRDAMTAVLVKISGNHRVPSQPTLAALVKEARNYVLEYGYVKQPAVADNTVATGGGIGLAVRFSPSEIDQVLHEAHIPRLPANRPSLLVWVVQGVAGSPAFAQREQDTTLFQQIDGIAARRAMPVSYPLQDLQDQVTLAPDQVWQFDEAAIQQGSSRYPVDGWLALRLYQGTDGNWRGAWLLKQNPSDPALLLESTGNTLQQLLDNVFDDALDRLASAYVYTGGDGVSELPLTIKGVNSFDSYQQLLSTLNSMSMVRQVKMELVVDQQLSLTLTVEGEASQVVAALERHGQFRREQSASPEVNPATAPLATATGPLIDPAPAIFTWIPIP